MAAYLHVLIFILLGTYLNLKVSAIQCPNGWITHDDSCYLFVDQQEDWPGSSAFCTELGAHLVTVQSDRENHFLQTTVQHLHGTNNKSVLYWMGGTDIATESEWVWAEKEQPITYSNWCPGQPDDNHGQDCLALGGFCSFKWDDNMCTHKGNFVCEITGSSEGTETIIG